MTILQATQIYKIRFKKKSICLSKILNSFADSKEALISLWFQDDKFDEKKEKIGEWFICGDIYGKTKTKRGI